MIEGDSRMIKTNDIYVLLVLFSEQIVERIACLVFPHWELGDWRRIIVFNYKLSTWLINHTIVIRRDSLVLVKALQLDLVWDSSSGKLLDIGFTNAPSWGYIFFQFEINLTGTWEILFVHWKLLPKSERN